MRGYDQWKTEGEMVTCPDCGGRHRAADVCNCVEVADQVRDRDHVCGTCTECHGGVCMLDGSFVDHDDSCDEWEGDE